MATRLLFVRHGATTLSAEDCFAGSTDVELSDEGRQQAKCLSERLASETLAAVYASPMQRTVHTAEILAAPHALSPLTRDGLREIDHGHWEGRSREDVASVFADEYRDWEADPFTFAPPGGESGLSVMARALPVVRELVLAHADSTVLVVSHKATIRLLLCSVLGIDARGYRDRLDLAPACLNVVDFKDATRARLMLYNDTSHYAARPRRGTAQLSPWWDAPFTEPGGRGS